MDYLPYIAVVVFVAAVAYFFWSRNDETDTPVPETKNPVPVVKNDNDKKVDSVPEKVTEKEVKSDVAKMVEDKMWKNNLEKDNADK